MYGLALGYEDLNDHDPLRHDPLLAVLAEADFLTAPLAGKSTLNRLELSPATRDATERYKKIAVDQGAVDPLFLDVFVAAHATAPADVVLDLDATDDPIHGRQEGRFFHGFYGGYCYLPLYIFCGEHLLCARLRTADRDASDEALAEVDRIVAHLRAVWPAVRIMLRMMRVHRATLARTLGALGTGSGRAHDNLIRAQHDAAAIVRCAAMSALGQRDAPIAALRGRLIHAGRHDPSDCVRAESLELLVSPGAPPPPEGESLQDIVLEVEHAALGDSSPIVREQATFGLAWIAPAVRG